LTHKFLLGNPNNRTHHRNVRERTPEQSCHFDRKGRLGGALFYLVRNFNHITVTRAPIETRE